MATKDWFPTSMPDQLVMFQNVAAKIDLYQTVLPITTAQQDMSGLLCRIRESGHNSSPYFLSR